MTWQPIETFVKPELAPYSLTSKSSDRVFLYFPDIKPSELIGHCRGEPAYGGVYWEWLDDNGEPFENTQGRVEPSHWAPMFDAPLPQHQREKPNG